MNTAAPLRFQVHNRRLYTSPNLDGRGVRRLVAGDVSIHCDRGLYEWRSWDVEQVLSNLAKESQFFLGKDIVFERYGEPEEEMPHQIIAFAVLRQSDDSRLLEVEVTAEEFRNAVALVTTRHYSWRLHDVMSGHDTQ